MSNKVKLALFLVGLYGLLVLLFAAVGVGLWADMPPQERAALLAILENRYGLAVFVILACWVIIGFIVHALYRAYVLAPLRLREQALVMVNVNPGLRLQATGAPEIRALAKVVNALAEQRDSLQRDVEERVREAKASVEAEKNRLAALMSELSQSVVVCNLDGRILRYSNRARLQFQAVGEGIQSSSGRALIGLGRSIFSILDRNLITHALDSIQHSMRRGNAQPVDEPAVDAPLCEISSHLLAAAMHHNYFKAIPRCFDDLARESCAQSLLVEECASQLDEDLQSRPSVSG